MKNWRREKDEKSDGGDTKTHRVDRGEYGRLEKGLRCGGEKDQIRGAFVKKSEEREYELFSELILYLEECKRRLDGRSSGRTSCKIGGGMI